MEQPHPARAREALASLSLCLLLASLGTSIANVALPTLTGAFAASFQDVQWVVLAYLLAVTSSILGVGRLADLYGRRRVLVAGLGLFTAASAVGALSPALWLVILARAVQGLGAAVLMAVPVAFVGEVVPKERTGGAMGLLGTTSAVGTALGPSLGGLLLAQLGWRAVFLVHVPLGVLALLLVRRSLPADRAPSTADRPRFDGAGTLVLALTLGAWSLAMTLGRGRPGLLNLALILTAALGAVLFARVEARAPSPLVRLAMFGERALSASLAANALVSTVVMATLVVGPFYLSRALGLDPAGVGLVLAAGPLVAALVGAPAGRLVDRFGTEGAATAGLVGIAAGCLALSAIPERFGIVGYVVPIAVLTASYALFQAANTTAVLRGASADGRGVVSAMLTLSRNLGLVTGAAVLGAVFTAAAGGGDLAVAPPENVAAGLRVTFGVAAALVAVALGIPLLPQAGGSGGSRSSSIG